MAIVQRNRDVGKRWALTVCFASGLAVVGWAGTGRGEAASLPATTHAAHRDIVPVQSGPAPENKPEPKKKTKKTKKRAIRCGGPGLPDCPM
jgi:hypothetical protein